MSMFGLFGNVIPARDPSVQITIQFEDAALASNVSAQESTLKTVFGENTDFSAADNGRAVLYVDPNFNSIDLQTVLAKTYDCGVTADRNTFIVHAP